jgi:lysyl-tRNA synthetase class 2
VSYQGEEIDLTPPFRRVTMKEIVKEHTGFDFDAVLSAADAKQKAGEMGIHVEGNLSKGEILNLIFEEKIEEFLIQPTFVMDYPVEVSPLTKRKPGDPDFTERFELFITKRELANAYSELNDPIDQRERFLRQVALRDAGDEEANMMDEDFLTSLEYGMPPTGGMGMGMDRLVMLLTDSASIRDVLLFPTMKPIDK